MQPSRTLEAYIHKLQDHVATSESRYVSLLRSGVVGHPIPFFGNPETAAIITIGVNPSAGEFVNRKWPAEMPPSTLTSRLAGYFADAPVPPHPWFEGWGRALEVLGSSYQTTAAHVDLSPRATAAMGSVPDWKHFLEMVEEDVAWFFRLLPLCREARLLLAAGCVTKRWYMNDFIKRMAPAYGFRLEGEATTSGPGRSGLHRLVGPSVDLPLFFCSVSPSARKKELLVQRVAEHQTAIGQFLAEPSTSGS